MPKILNGLTTLASRFVSLLISFTQHLFEHACCRNTNGHLVFILCQKRLRRLRPTKCDCSLRVFVCITPCIAEMSFLFSFVFWCGCRCRHDVLLQPMWAQPPKQRRDAAPRLSPRNVGYKYFHDITPSTSLTFLTPCRGGGKKKKKAFLHFNHFLKD